MTLLIKAVDEKNIELILTYYPIQKTLTILKLSNLKNLKIQNIFQNFRI
jgi:hypothetical protein